MQSVRSDFHDKIKKPVYIHGRVDSQSNFMESGKFGDRLFQIDILLLQIFSEIGYFMICPFDFFNTLFQVYVEVFNFPEL